MTPLELLEKFYRQSAIAAAFVCLVWLAMEKFVPGFIVPFANLPLFVLVVLFFLASSVFLSSATNAPNIVMRFLVFVVAASIGWYAYAKVEMTTMGLALALVTGAASLVLLMELSNPGQNHD